MKRIKKEESLGIASELIKDQMKRTRFWFCAFVVAAIAFSVSCIRIMTQK